MVSNSGLHMPVAYPTGNANQVTYETKAYGLFVLSHKGSGYPSVDVDHITGALGE